MRVLILGRIAWAMTTKDKDYVKMIGWRKVVREPEHRKELVAGNLANFAISGMFILSFFCKGIG